MNIFFFFKILLYTFFSNQAYTKYNCDDFRGDINIEIISFEGNISFGFIDTLEILTKEATFFINAIKMPEIATF